MVHDRSFRNGPLTRRDVVAASSAGAASVAGCQSQPQRAGDDASRTTDASAATDPTTGQQRDPQTMFQNGFPGIVVTTDGTTVTAVDGEGVVAEDADTGAVMASVFEAVAEAGVPQGRHVHFTRGEFPWHSSVATGAVGLTITGEWNATRWNAESEIPWFVRFGEKDGWVLRGPRVANLQYDAKGNADYFLRFDVVSQSLVERIYGVDAVEAMILAKPDWGYRFVDHNWFRHCRAQGSSLAVMESGAAGIPADCKFERCICNDPGDYGLVLRDVHRIQVDRFFTGFGPDSTGDAGVLIENPAVGEADAAKRNTMGCQLNMVEIEDNTDAANAAAVHIRSPADSHSQNNHSHQLHHIRARQNGDVKHLVVENEGDGDLESIRLRGVMPRPLNEGAITIDGAVECDLEFEATGGIGGGDETDPRAFLTDEGTRTILNGVSHNEGPPSEGGQWNGHGREGVTVLDTENRDLYVYADGEWVGQS
jgi:hypothetical protein